MEGHIESEHKDIYKSSLNTSDNIESEHKNIYKLSINQSENIESDQKNIYKSSLNQSDNNNNIEIGHKIVIVKSSLNQSEKEENLKFPEILSVTSEDQTEENSIIIQNRDAGDNFNIIIRTG